MAVLTMLSRSYCHLCDEMREALAPIAESHSAAVIEVDVDAYPDLEAQYGDRVPLLFLGAPADRAEVCHYRLDRDAVLRALTALA
jgi:thiol-disulfide isomerase/thioredoxin